MQCLPDSESLQCKDKPRTRVQRHYRSAGVRVWHDEIICGLGIYILWRDDIYIHVCIAGV